MTIERRSSLIHMAIRLLTLLLLLFATLAQAGQVTGPNGEYKESHTDLSVKVLGGAVSVERSWLNGRWYVNPAWADLQFTYDALDGSVKTIDRAGSVFEGSGDLFVFDDRFFMRKTTQEVNGEPVSGWRWSNTGGDWVDYDADGKIVAYGDRHDVSVRFVRNGDGLISAVRDDRDALVLAFTYTNGQPTTITDRAGRSVSYTWTGTNLSSVQDVFGHVWTYTYDGNGQITGGKAPVGVSFSGVAGRASCGAQAVRQPWLGRALLPLQQCRFRRELSAPVPV
ncbi:MAG: RHS repeat protein [Xanthomonadales bacterium]|nr:RHS repeat protein [Xanthomonadales bacterium]